MTSEHIESKCPSCNELIEFRVESVNSDTSHAHDSVTVGDCPRCGRIELDESPDATLTYIQAAGRSTGDMVAHFDLVRLLGRGAFGAVWLAVDRRLQRRVALKLPVSNSADPY